MQTSWAVQQSQGLPACQVVCVALGAKVQRAGLLRHTNTFVGSAGRNGQNSRHFSFLQDQAGGANQTLSPISTFAEGHMPVSVYINSDHFGITQADFNAHPISALGTGRLLRILHQLYTIIRPHVILHRVTPCKTKPNLEMKKERLLA